MRKEIEDRLIAFAVRLIRLCEHSETSFVGVQLADQVFHSVTTATLTYGEAQDAASKKEFTEAIGIVLRELRETNINLRIMALSGLVKIESTEMNYLLDESNQLVAIFHKTAMTSNRNN